MRNLNLGSTNLFSATPILSVLALKVLTNSRNIDLGVENVNIAILGNPAGDGQKQPYMYVNIVCSVDF